MPAPLNVLIVEDSVADAELVLRELRRAGYDPNWRRVDTEAAFLAQLGPDLDLVLSDFRMPQFGGMRALELLHERQPGIPFILISGTIGEDAAVQAMKHGAIDYLLKDRLTRLGSAVAHALTESRLARERRQAELALQIAHHQLGQLLEQSPAVLYVLKLEGEKIIPQLASEHIVELLGFTPAETLTHEWWVNRLHPDDREAAVASFGETLEAGTSRTEYRVQHKHGGYRWIDDARRVLRDAAGKPIEFIGVWSDISERKRAEEVLARASGRLARDRRRSVRLELLILALVAGSVYALAAAFGWFEVLRGWFPVRTLQQWHGIMFAVIFLAAGLAVFAFRRWRETVTELSSHQQVQAALSLMHDELDLRVKQRTAELRGANEALRTEIADRQRAVEALRVSEERFRSYFELGLIGMAITAPTFEILEVNNELCKIVGYPPDELRGKTWVDFTHPDDLETSNAQYARISAGAIDGYAQEKRYLHKDGRVVYAMLAVRCARRKDGAIDYLIALVEDITERKRSELALVESEARFRALAENIQEVFWITGPSQRPMVYVSPGYERIWGRTCASLYAAPLEWLHSIHPDDRARVEAAMKTKQVAGTYDEEYRILRPDGMERWIRDRAFPVRGPDGALQHMVGVAEDITESKRLHEQFLRAQRMEAIGTLAGGIAHDLNNILAPVLMAPALLRGAIKTEGDQKLLDMIEQGAQRGSNIVRQLLTFSRGSGGERVSVQLRHLVKEMVGIMRETFPRDIVIEDHTSRDLRPVLGDPTQLHQVLMNLCVNARDAMPGGGSLRLAAENRDLGPAEVAPHAPAKPGPFVALSVTDSGQGIPADIVGRIFDPFFTTKPPSKGTGLGLSTVLGIVRSHHGFITVASVPGTGTAFTVHLPAAAREEGGPGAAEPDAPPRGRGELILVVDDEAPIRAATRLTLEKFGYRVLTAADGAEALATFLRNRATVQLVLTDVMMPVMGGLGLIRALRAADPRVKVVATSGLNDQASYAELKAAGVDDILAKPCGPRELLAALHTQLLPAA